MSKLLIDEQPIAVLPKLAKKIGLNEAIVLQQLHYWSENPKIGLVRDGRKWVRNTYQEWIADNFPFWSVNTLRRALDKLKELELIDTTQTLNKAKYDKTLWYSIDYDELEKYAEPKPLPKMGSRPEKATAQNGQIDLPEMGKPIPETTQRLQKTKDEKIAADAAAPRPTKKSKQRDERIDHPAYQVYQELARLSVPYAWRDEVCKINDIEKWREVVMSWLGKHKPNNIEGMIDVYYHGWKAGKSNGATPTRTFADALRDQQKGAP